MLWYGNEGVRKLALTNFQRTAYLKKQLEGVEGIRMMGQADFFNEFAFSFGIPFAEVDAFYQQHGIAPGVDLGRYYPSLGGMILVAVTEIKDKDQLDQYVKLAKELIATKRKTS
jgi:glycine dehydrogenase subunit 1